MSHRLARKLGWNALGLAIFAVMIFPVFWMISTSFKTTDQINSLKPTWFPGHPTLRHFENAIHKPYFWADVKNTLIVVLIAVGVAMVLAFFAAVALEKYRFSGRKAFLVLLIGVQMIPGIGLIIPVLPILIGEFTTGRDTQAYWYGAVAVTYGATQFLCAPLLGALSDRFGRRPVILLE